MITLFESMEITEEQRRRAEANRLAALEKRKRTEERLRDGPWRFFRCRKIPSSTSSSSSSALVPKKKPSLLPRMPEPPEPLKRFLVVLEICSPDEFAVLPEPLPGFIFPSVVECLRIIEAALVSVLHFRISESQGSQGCLRALVYRLNDYDLVLKCLRKLSIADLQDIPYITLLAVRSFQDHVSIGRIPCWKEHYSEKQVDDLMIKLPKTLRSALLPFQLDGVRFGLLRGARCLIADEMGLGKTIQVIFPFENCFLVFLCKMHIQANNTTVICLYLRQN
ncbi:hypothetical protein HPP92_013437 [Vanilla planifolia]|uniref:SNF2 N-terminal domain-containing protein n=1 Tax=Vanilla planifolia TaxID=51239 RepID=A0A835QT18_VANPL|nr:hypothetical protein HPP92_013437 [Vanilla planifolia]